MPLFYLTKSLEKVCGQWEGIGVFRAVGNTLVPILLPVSKTEGKGKMSHKCFPELFCAHVAPEGRVWLSKLCLVSSILPRWLSAIISLHWWAGCISFHFIPWFLAEISFLLLFPESWQRGEVLCIILLCLLFLWCQNGFTWPVWNGVCSTILINYADTAGEEDAKHCTISIQKHFLRMKKGRAEKQKKAER